MNEIIDGSQMLGASINGDTYSTIIDDTMGIQIAYHFLKPMAEWRSVDGSDKNVLSWRPEKESWQRHREWRESGFHIPEDVSLSEDALGVLTDVRGVSRDSGDQTFIEIYTPPLDAQDCRHLKQHLLVDHDVIATQGEGRDPLLVEDNESVETLKSFQLQW